MLESFVRAKHHAWDVGTYREVITDDCYHLKDRRFGISDVIIDIGANIGLFSGLVLEKGAGLVVSVEASPYNFTTLAQNLSVYPCSVCLNRAVWRSDVPPEIFHLNPIPENGNTGGVTVLENTGPQVVETIGLDTLISEEQVTYLKVDCEGSEFPIIYTSKRLGQVKEIAMELHPVDHLLQGSSNVRPGENTPEGMAAFLTAQGFKVQLEARADMALGWAYLWACR